eukprot:scaffold2003_cov139-Cylindrotheca_fusiformis.AAC.16
MTCIESFFVVVHGAVIFLDRSHHPARTYATCMCTGLQLRHGIEVRTNNANRGLAAVIAKLQCGLQESVKRSMKSDHFDHGHMIHRALLKTEDDTMDICLA